MPTAGTPQQAGSFGITIFGSPLLADLPPVQPPFPANPVPVPRPDAGKTFGCTIAPGGPSPNVSVAETVIRNVTGGAGGAAYSFGVRLKSENDPTPQLSTLAPGTPYGIGSTALRALDAALLGIFQLGFNPYDLLLTWDVQIAWLVWLNSGGASGGGGKLQSIGLALPAVRP